MIAPALISEDAEQAVLAALLMDGEPVLTIVRGEIRSPEAFAVEGHRALYDTMARILDAGGRLDPLTLTHQLDADGTLEAIGGRDYIGFLIDAIPTAANVEYHAKIVRELADRRKGIALSERLALTFADRAIPVPDIAGEAASLLAGLVAHRVGAGFKPLREAVTDALFDLERRMKGEDDQAIRFGYRELDAFTCGVQRGEFVLLIGAPMHGKTAFALNIADHVAERGTGVGFVSAEMSARALASRLLSKRALVDGKRLRDATRLRDDDFPRLARAQGMLSSLPIYVYDATRPTVSAVSAQCRGLKAKHPGVGLVVVDVLQLIEAEGMKESRALELDRIAYALKGLAKELDVVVLATVHADGRKLDERSDHRPRLADIAWSQAPEKACDVAIAVWREALYDASGLTPDVLRWAILKGRDVGLAEGLLRWDGAHMLVSDVG